MLERVCYRLGERTEESEARHWSSISASRQRRTMIDLKPW